MRGPGPEDDCPRGSASVKKWAGPATTSCRTPRSRWTRQYRSATFPGDTESPRDDGQPVRDGLTGPRVTKAVLAANPASPDPRTSATPSTTDTTGGAGWSRRWPLSPVPAARPREPRRPASRATMARCPHPKPAVPPIPGPPPTPAADGLEPPPGSRPGDQCSRKTFVDGKALTPSRRHDRSHVTGARNGRLERPRSNLHIGVMSDSWERFTAPAMYRLPMSFALHRPGGPSTRGRSRIPVVARTHRTSPVRVRRGGTATVAIRLRSTR